MGKKYCVSWYDDNMNRHERWANNIIYAMFYLLFRTKHCAEIHVYKRLK